MAHCPSLRSAVRPNPSVKRTRNGVAPGPRGRVVYPRPHGPGATPLRAAYLERYALSLRLGRLAAESQHRRTAAALPSAAHGHGNAARFGLAVQPLGRSFTALASSARAGALAPPGGTMSFAPEATVAPGCARGHAQGLCFVETPRDATCTSASRATAFLGLRAGSRSRGLFCLQAPCLRQGCA